MGVCQSAPKEAVVSTSSKTSKETIPERKGSTRTPSPKSHPIDDVHEYHSDGSSEGKTAELSVSHTSSPRTPISGEEQTRTSKTTRGYSSGGSSESPDHSNTSAHNHLADWKHELSSNGELSAAVVRIETDFGRSIDEIYEGVHDGPVLGTGVSGVVRKVKHRRTEVAYAAKCLDLGMIRDERGLQALRDEIFIMCQLDHPNIVRLEEVYESETDIFLIQELCLGGDLFDRLDEQPDYHYSEARCAMLVKQMLSSVRYLHSKNIIHRDLKLENFLFSSTDSESELKMIDFGLSKHFTFLGEVQHECVGTPYTVAPEVIRAEYDEKIDLWALGVITYLLLSGETPFGGVDGECLDTVRINILKGSLVFEPKEIWQHVSEAGKKFLGLLLNPEASKRPTAKEAQLDQWIQTYGKKGTDEGAKLSPKIVQALVEFREYSDMRKVLCEVLSFTLLPEQICELRKEFEKIDHDCDGEISLSELKQVLAEKAEDGSLGVLTEGQVDDLFNALRLRKSDPTIRWHEFIAAGLSQCNFDERNLKLAFDRLDYDRTGFITLEDMRDLLGNNSDDNGEVLKMWQEGMKEYSCPLGRITYEDFRMILKGQRREREQASSRRRSSCKATMEGSPLQAVPEGSMSPQARHSVFAKFEDISALDSLKMPALGVSPVGGKKIETPNIQYPMDVADGFPLSYKRTRSGSLGHTPAPLLWLDPDDDMPISPPQDLDLTSPMLDPDDNMSISLPQNLDISSPMPKRSSHVILRNRVIGGQEAPSSRTASDGSQEAFRQHHEFRKSVLQASKKFEKKVLARKLEIAATKASKAPDSRRASLIMRREPQKVIQEIDQARFRHRESGKPESGGRSESCSRDQVTSENQVADASRRSGRPRRERRRKTTSDISGMLR